MTESLGGKVALVTGGGSGIGRATALAFARAGAKVVVSDVNAGGGEATVDHVKQVGGQATFVAADVTQAGEVAALVARTVEICGRLDYAFNNAGISSAALVPDGTPIHDYPEEAWDRLIDINLKGVWLCMKYELPQMLRQGGGAIVNAASIMGLVGGANFAYNASKHGVVGLTKSAALFYAAQSIRVNAVCPGYVRTPMTERIWSDPERAREIAARHPMGRFGTAEEVAETVVWLCSDAASFVTGVALPVDGGYVAI